MADSFNKLPFAVPWFLHLPFELYCSSFACAVRLSAPAVSLTDRLPRLPVFRTSRSEQRRAAAAEAANEARLERLYAAVERQLGSQERPTASAGAGAVRRPVSRAAIRQLSSGQQIYECVAAAADPGTVEVRGGRIAGMGDAGQRGMGDAGQRGMGDAGRRGETPDRGGRDAGQRGIGDAGQRGIGDAGQRGWETPDRGDGRRRTEGGETPDSGG